MTLTITLCCQKCLSIHDKCCTLTCVCVYNLYFGIIYSALKRCSISTLIHLATNCFGRFPSLQLAADIIHPSQHIRVLGVVISADLGLEKHATNVSAVCFYHLHQLRHIRRTLSKESATTLLHAYVMSRVDYCNAIFAGAPKSTTKLQRVMNAAARVVKRSLAAGSMIAA